MAMEKGFSTGLASYLISILKCVSLSLFPFLSPALMEITAPPPSPAAFSLPT